MGSKTSQGSQVARRTQGTPGKADQRLAGWSEHQVGDLGSVAGYVDGHGSTLRSGAFGITDPGTATGLAAPVWSDRCSGATHRVNHWAEIPMSGLLVGADGLESNIQKVATYARDRGLAV